MSISHANVSKPAHTAFIRSSHDMVKDEKDFARLPGARIINRYMPDTSLEAREQALENLKKLLATLLDIEERKIGDGEAESSNPIRSQQS